MSPFRGDLGLYVWSTCPGSATRLFSPVVRTRDAALAGDFVDVCIDDHSRVAFSEIKLDEPAAVREPDED